MAPKKTTAAKKAPAKPRAKKEAKTIRNLRFTPVHIRLGNQGENPYRIQLAPRGQLGDTSTVPVALQDDHAYVAGLNVLFEIITQTESRKIAYEPTGYQPTEVVRVERPEDTVVSVTPDWDGKGQPPKRQMGPTYPNVPGSDTGLHEQLSADPNPAMPDVPTKVVIERSNAQPQR